MSVKFLFAGLISGILISCQSDQSNENQVELGESKSAEVVASCQCDELVKSDKDVYLLNGDPYTGNCIILYQNSDKKYIEKQYLEGKMNGEVIYYDQAGNVIYRENYVQGEYKKDLATENIHCNCKVLTKETVNNQTKLYYKGQLFTGTCSDQYLNSDQDYIKSSYKNGLLDGYKTYYTKDGTILYQEKYQSNTLVTTIYPE